MTKDELKQYWLDTSENDYRTMNNLFRSGDYSWSLFIGHLVIEKLLKALYVLKVDTNPPKTHDLIRIAEKIGVEITDELEDKLDIITTFNLNARYPDYKLNFYKKCDSKFTASNISIIEEVRRWLISLIEMK